MSQRIRLSMRAPHGRRRPARGVMAGIAVGVAGTLAGSWACGPRQAAPAAPAPMVIGAFAAPAPPPRDASPATAAPTPAAPRAAAPPSLDDLTLDARIPAPAPLPAPQVPRVPAEAVRSALPVAGTLRLSSTAYCLRGAMRTGVRTREGMAAADPRVIPLGSVVRVRHADGDEIGLFVIMDTGGAIKGNKLDIYMPSCGEAIRWGRRPVVAEVIRIGRR